MSGGRVASRAPQPSERWWHVHAVTSSRVAGLSLATGNQEGERRLVSVVVGAALALGLLGAVRKVPRLTLVGLARQVLAFPVITSLVSATLCSALI